jgi:bloom syndrome protein
MLITQLGPNCRDFMTGHRKLKLQVKVSASPAAASKQCQPFPSTILTSPIAEPRKRRAHAIQDDSDEDVDHPYGAPDDFVAPDSEDEEEYFEPLQSRGKQREATPAGLGPPVTTDERMEALPELHRVFVYQFVEEAKKVVDRIKNDRNLARLFFTESNLREMAISWTVTLTDMRQISGINVDAVNKWGKHIIPIVARYSKNYDDAMNGREDRDIDKNHQNVIDLCSDDDEEEFGLDDSEEEAIFQAEQQGSKYFQTPQMSGSSSHTRRIPRQTESRAGSAAPRTNNRGNGFQYRNRSRKGGSRRSAGSTSGQSNSGASKKKATGGAKKAGSSAASKSSSLFKQFGHQGNSGGRSSGGMGGGIGMMPT